MVGTRACLVDCLGLHELEELLEALLVHALDQREKQVLVSLDLPELPLLREHVLLSVRVKLCVSLEAAAGVLGVPRDVEPCLVGRKQALEHQALFVEVQGGAVACGDGCVSACCSSKLAGERMVIPGGLLPGGGGELFFQRHHKPFCLPCNCRNGTESVSVL